MLRFLKNLFDDTPQPQNTGKIIAAEAIRCVQCGVCSYNCPVEIDVRSFAYRGLMVTDSRCITCGACAEVCPRGTLSLVDRPRMASVLSESGQEEDLPSTLGLQPAFALRS